VANPANGELTGHRFMMVLTTGSPLVASTCPHVGFSKVGRWVMHITSVASPMHHNQVLGHAAPKFVPEVSATLKGDNGRQLLISMNRSAILISAALRVMHPTLYFAGVETLLRLGTWAHDAGLHEMHDRIVHWASVFNVATIMCNRRSPPHRDPKCRPEAFDIMTSIGVYDPAIMTLKNFGITLKYDSCVMVAFSCHLVVHEMYVESGDRIVWAWFMRDSIHNYVGTPRSDFARYDQLLNAATQSTLKM
jgi:hypothetical protein